jgi:Arc/MetJ family transcription regulator
MAVTFPIGLHTHAIRGRGASTLQENRGLAQIHLFDDLDFRMPWFSRFDVPIKLAGRLSLRTLAEARGFIRQLPQSEQARVEWESAAALLTEAAKRGGAHISIARTAVERALRRLMSAASGRR